MNDDPLPIIDLEAPGADGPPESPPTPPRSVSRKDEVEAKQRQIAKLLGESGAEGVLLFDPPNLAWLTGANLCQAISDPGEWPAVFLTDTQRWLLSSSADTQRIFDLAIDGLGFQLKEWPWHWGREQLLSDLVQHRKMACDRVLANSVPLGPTFRRSRLPLTSPERERLAALGKAVAHALEATCRNLEPGQSEEEVAGQVAHRLVKHGIVPAALHVAADRRSRRHRRTGISDARIEHCCVVSATGQRHGLHATAARSVLFGEADAPFRQHHTVACQIIAAQAAAARPRTPIADIIEAGRRVAELRDCEPEWFRGPIGHVTGWLPVERPIVPTLTYQIGGDWAVVWQAGIGSAFAADTWLIGEQPLMVTRPEMWPIQRVKVGGRAFDIPDVLVMAR